jgi:hypothetical protein
VLARVAEVDIVVPVEQVHPGIGTDADVEAATVAAGKVKVHERGVAEGGIVDAGGVVAERAGAEGGIPITTGIGAECGDADGGVAEALRVALERAGAEGSVAEAGGVTLERG